MARRSWRALQSQYWMSNRTISSAWLTSRTSPFLTGTLGPGSSTWNRASRLLFLANSAPSSLLSTAYTLIPPSLPTPCKAFQQQPIQSLVGFDPIPQIGETVILRGGDRLWAEKPGHSQASSPTDLNQEFTASCIGKEEEKSEERAHLSRAEPEGRLNKEARHQIRRSHSVHGDGCRRRG
jgi:hypothetical protein